MLISPAYAQSADPTGGLMSLLPLVLIFVVFYFILIRPQQRKAKEHRAMLAALKKGDRVVTGGGVLANVVRVSPESDEVVVEIARNPQVRVTVVKSTIQTVMREEEEAAAKAADRPAEERAKGKAGQAEAPEPAPASEAGRER
ncbi:MAG: preprotein translocase subunit YajC [Acetobacteraceae bacterium]